MYFSNVFIVDPEEANASWLNAKRLSFSVKKPKAEIYKWVINLQCSNLFFRTTQTFSKKFISSILQVTCLNLLNPTLNARKNPAV